jgi:uncharacterized membrane protein YraQ (UPF0718 family)
MELLAESALSTIGFFWKALWAFILGYSISAMIQTFVPKNKLANYLATSNAKSISLGAIFGSASSSCSFAALATARSLVAKGASFIVAVVFMFASTNLVIELGILIWIFLGPGYLAAEIIGGIILIVISSLLMKLIKAKSILAEARKRAEAQEIEENFDWRKRIKSKEGWLLVGKKFVAEWQMVWQEILIGFTIAGLVATLVPDAFWQQLFLTNASELPRYLVILENILIAPLVAAFTFIGSMGNIPLATVLSSKGVAFAGVMGFIYSDLIVPPLVMVNRKYYGLKAALYIALIMYLSILATTFLMQLGADLLGFTPESTTSISELSAFKLDYTFWLNLVFLALASFWTYFASKKAKQEGQKLFKLGKLNLKTIITLVLVVILTVGLISGLWV